jgi:hypothetical protein
MDGWIDGWMDGWMDGWSSDGRDAVIAQPKDSSTWLKLLHIVIQSRFTFTDATPFCH